MTKTRSAAPKIAPPFRVTPVHAAVAFAIYAMSSHLALAQTDCGTRPVGSYSTTIRCTPASGDAEITVQNGTTIDVTNSNAIVGLATIGSTTINISGTTIGATATGSAVNGVLARANAATGIDTKVNLAGTNTITIDSDGTPISSSAISAAVRVDNTLSRGENVINVTGTLNATNNIDSSYSAHGLYVHGAGTDSRIVHTGSGTIETHGGNGVYIESSTTGTIELGSDVKVVLDNTNSGTYTNSAVRVNGNSKSLIESSAEVRTRGNNAWGIASLAFSDSRVLQKGSVYTDGIGSYGVSVTADSGVSVGTNTGTIETMQDSSPGIYTTTSRTGPSLVFNLNTITTHGASSEGMYATTGSGDVEATNTGVIETFGDSSHGINAVSGGTGNTKVVNGGQITTNGTTNASGIRAVSPNNVTVEAGGLITTNGTGANNHGIQATSGNGTASIGFGNGAVSVAGQSVGLLAESNGSGPAANALVQTTNSMIDATRSTREAISASAYNSATVAIDQSAAVRGGATYAVATAGTTQSITNAGTIDALSDRAIRSNDNGAPVGTATLLNAGTVTGSIDVANAATTLTNAGIWNLRNFADTNGDGVRDTLGVSVSNFGSSGKNTVVNAGAIQLIGDDGTAIALNTTGAYATGYAANTMALNGPAQAQILGVQAFVNSGVIDLQSNGRVGDVLVISGGSTPGTSGGGVYVANGGALKLDTVLNEGGATNSQSDMLVVDGTSLGSGGATTIALNTTGAGALTTGNGIELVRVLDNTRSADGVFRINGRVVSGAYEYDLYKGGTGASANDGNWYLRTIGQQPSRPEPYLYVRNLAAASAMFVHTLHDRLGEPQYTEAYRDKAKAPKDDRATAGWVRVVASHADSESAGGRVGLDTDTTLIHFGGDIARWSDDEKNRYHFGLMGAYGKSDTDAYGRGEYRTTNNGTRRKASGDVEGYSVGVYGTWFGNDKMPEGPYVDVWAMYGWYDNTVKGNGFAKEKYDSQGWTVSVEGGYALIAREEEKRQWIIEPQVQLAYTNFSADNHREADGTRVNNSDANGFIGRLGARFYSRSKLGDNGVQPFVEGNIWYSDAKNSLDFNGVRISDGTPDTRYELKLGAQGEIKRNWQLWGHIGGQWGKDNYDRYEAMIGTKYMF